MSQRRIQDFGTPVVAASIKSLAKSFVVGEILEGMEFVVDGTNRVRVNPGSAITHEGVIIIEDEFKFIEIASSSVPMDYTIFYSHVDADISGGVPAVLTLDSGLLTKEFVEGVILGYVRYPGGAVPLATEHFIQPPVLKIGDVRPTSENERWVIPVRNTGYMVTATSGGTIDITDTFDVSATSPEMYVTFRNNTTVTGGVVLTFPFKVRERRYSILQLTMGTDINVLVTPSFIDSDGTVFPLVSSPFSSEPDLELKTLDIPRESVQNLNGIVYIQIDVSMVAARELRLQSIGLNQYNLPV